MKIIAISILRHETLMLAAVKRASKWAIVFEHQIPSKGSPLAVVDEMFGNIPPGWKGAEIRISLSPAYLACNEVVSVPYKNETQLDAVAPALAESYCAGESAEELIVDVLRVNKDADTSRIQLLAARRTLIDGLYAALAKRGLSNKIALVSAAGFSLSRIFVDSNDVAVQLSSAQETFLITQGSSGSECRSFPGAGDRASRQGVLLNSSSLRVIAEDDFCDHELLERPLKGRHMVAAGLLALNPDTSCNLVRALSGNRERKQSGWKFVAAAVVLLFISVGRYCEVQSSSVRQQLVRLAEIERRATAKMFPQQRHAPGRLLAEIQGHIRKLSRFKAANPDRSSIVIWKELGKCMPDPDAIGLTLESAQFDSNGGRVVVRVSSGAEDPLVNASQFEQAINRSAHLAARSEFENKGTEIVVRMQMELTSGKVQGTP